MKNIFTAFPQVLFIDGTYKLLKLSFVVVIFVVEDSNNTSEIVGFGLLTKENIESYIILLQAFKNYMSEESCDKIKVMTDKDSSEKVAVSSVFPHVKLHICRFHSLQIFQRYLASKNFSKIEKEGCFRFFF